MGGVFRKLSFCNTRRPPAPRKSSRANKVPEINGTRNFLISLKWANGTRTPIHETTRLLSTILRHVAESRRHARENDVAPFPQKVNLDQKKDLLIISVQPRLLNLLDKNPRSFSFSVPNSMTPISFSTRLPFLFSASCYLV